MRSMFLTALVLGLLAGVSSAQDKKAEKKATVAKPSPFKTDKEKVSYGIGHNVGMSIAGQLKSDGLNIETKLLLLGFADALNGSDPKISPDDFRAAFESFQKAANAAKGAVAKKWLVENAKKPGVKTTKSGLQYKIVKAGTGASPKATDTVVTHYTGTLIDGTKFDSSRDRGEPATFGVGQVIKGWTEALQLMKVGGRWQLFIPSELAYGDRPPGRSPIKAGDTLVFDIELIGIEKAEAPKIKLNN